MSSDSNDEAAKLRRDIAYYDSMAEIPPPTHTLTDREIYRWHAKEARDRLAELEANPALCETCGNPAGYCGPGLCPETNEAVDDWRDTP